MLTLPVNDSFYVFLGTEEHCNDEDEAYNGWYEHWIDDCLGSTLTSIASFFCHGGSSLVARETVERSQETQSTHIVNIVKTCFIVVTSEDKLCWRELLREVEDDSNDKEGASYLVKSWCIVKPALMIDAHPVLYSPKPYDDDGNYDLKLYRPGFFPISTHWFEAC